MFFHGSGPLTETQGDFDKNASIGVAWSNDMVNWDWPGKSDKKESKVEKKLTAKIAEIFAEFAKSDLLTINFAVLCAFSVFFAVKMTFETASIY